MYIKSHPPRLSSFCTVRPVFASQRLDLRTFRRSDVLFPAPASGPQVLLLSKLKAPLNHAESTLLQVFFLKNLKPFEITTYEKPGEGSPLDSQPSIFRTLFQVPYPASPLLACPPWRATLTKTPGGMGVFFPFWNSPAIQFASRMELRDLFLSLRLSRRSDVQTFRHLYLPVVIK